MGRFRVDEVQLYLDVCIQCNYVLYFFTAVRYRFVGNLESRYVLDAVFGPFFRFIVLEFRDQFRVLQHLIQETAFFKGVVLGEVVHRLVHKQHFLLFILCGQYDILGKILAEFKVVLGVEIFIGQRSKSKELFNPILGIIPVAVHRKDLVALLRIPVEDQAPLVESLQVNPLLYQQIQVGPLFLELQEILLYLAFEDPQGINALIVQQGIGHVNHIALPALNMRVFGLAVQVAGDFRGDLMQGFRRFKDLAGRFINGVEFQSGFVMEAKIVLFLLPERFEKIFFEEPSDFVIKRVGGLGDKKGFSSVFVSNAVQGYGLELGSVQV